MIPIPLRAHRGSLARRLPGFVSALLTLTVLGFVLYRLDFAALGRDDLRALAARWRRPVEGT